MSYIFMLCSCRLNKCSISYWQSIMNLNTIKQQIEIIIMKNRWLSSLLLVSIIYLVLFYFNFTAYIEDYFEEEKYGFCIHCNMSVMCGTCERARTLLHWIVKWWRLSLLHTLWWKSPGLFPHIYIAHRVTQMHDIHRSVYKVLWSLNSTTTFSWLQPKLVRSIDLTENCDLYLNLIRTDINNKICTLL